MRRTPIPARESTQPHMWSIDLDLRMRAHSLPVARLKPLPNIAPPSPVNPLAASRDPALAGAAAERLGQEFNLPPQAEASLRNHIAAALEPLSAFPTDALRSERLIDIEVPVPPLSLAFALAPSDECYCDVLVRGSDEVTRACPFRDQFDIKDNDGNSVFKDTIKWRATDVISVTRARSMRTPASTLVITRSAPRGYADRNVNDVLGRMSGPETFAFTTCADLGLGPKYRVRICGAITIITLIEPAPTKGGWEED